MPGACRLAASAGSRNSDIDLGQGFRLRPSSVPARRDCGALRRASALRASSSGAVVPGCRRRGSVVVASPAEGAEVWAPAGWNGNRRQANQAVRAAACGILLITRSPHERSTVRIDLAGRPRPGHLSVACHKPPHRHRRTPATDDSRPGRQPVVRPKSPSTTAPRGCGFYPRAPDTANLSKAAAVRCVAAAQSNPQAAMPNPRSTRPVSWGSLAEV